MNLSMKGVLALSVILSAVVCQAEPRVEFECAVFMQGAPGPTDLRVYEDSETKESFIQQGEEKDPEVNPLEKAQRSEDGPSVHYRGSTVSVSLYNQGGSASRWDGSARFDKNGSFYSLESTVGYLYCQLK